MISKGTFLVLVYFIFWIDIHLKKIASPNILIDGPELSPLLIDFGVARLIDLDHKMTRAVGSFAWMAPGMKKSIFPPPTLFFFSLPSIHQFS